MTIRSPIVSVLGHVDHGKTTLLDKIRGTSIAAGEAGAITQHVGASFIPTEVIQSRCGEMLKKHRFRLTIPGLLFVDTPGHEAFTNLRRRGGSVADLAVLVVDVMQGIQPQTAESVEILKSFKTPFVVAANKIDLITGWIPRKECSCGETLESQRDFVKDELDRKIYKIVGDLASHGINSERYDRVDDITKQVLILPISSKTGEGFEELLMFLAGLAQKFMGEKLHVDVKKPGRGTVLEVKEVHGLGITVDAIVYEGCIKTGDKIAFADLDGPRIAKVRALFEPAPLEEIRDPHKKFKSVDSVYAAAGVKIAAPGLEKAVAGSPLIVVEDIKKAKQEIAEELEELRIEKDVMGVVIKTDAFGSLEAVVSLLKKDGVPVKRADVGPVTKRDVAEAEAVKRENRYLGVIFAFNTAIVDDAKKEAKKRGVTVFSSDVIYRLQEDYERWKDGEKEREKRERLDKYVYPAKIVVLPGCIFRVSKPAVVGVEVLGGIIKPRYKVMNEHGDMLGEIESIQQENKSLDRAEKGAQVAVAIGGITVGRQLHEKDVLYTVVQVRQLDELEKEFDDKDLIKEIRKIRGG